MRALNPALSLACLSLAGQQPDAPPKPYTVEGIRAWHRGFPQWPWHYQPESVVNLRDSGPPQILLCVGGGLRSGEFVIFARIGTTWRPVSTELDQSHHPFRILRHRVAGWHDFETYVPLMRSEREEVLVPRYRWNGRGYVEISRRSGRWKDFAPFKALDLP